MGFYSWNIRKIVGRILMEGGAHFLVGFDDSGLEKVASGIRKGILANASILGRWIVDSPYYGDLVLDGGTHRDTN